MKKCLYLNALTHDLQAWQDTYYSTKNTVNYS